LVNLQNRGERENRER